MENELNQVHKTRWI